VKQFNKGVLKKNDLHLLQRCKLVLGNQSHNLLSQTVSRTASTTTPLSNTRSRAKPSNSQVSSSTMVLPPKKLKIAKAMLRSPTWFRQPWNMSKQKVSAFSTLRIIHRLPALKSGLIYT